MPLTFEEIQHLTTASAKVDHFPFFSLPGDIQRTILLLLSPEQAWVFRGVCRRSLALVHEPELWSYYCQLYPFVNELPPKFLTRLNFMASFAYMGKLIQGATPQKKEFIFQILRQDIREVTLQLQSEATRASLNTEPWPLVAAAQVGNITIMDLLLKAGALPNQGGTVYSFTPLTCTARYGQTRAARFLIDQGKADFTHRDKYGFTALHYAALHGQLAWIETFLRENKLACDAVFNQSHLGITPLHMAALGGHLAVVQAFEQAGYNIHALDETILGNGRSLLDWCCATGFVNGMNLTLPKSNANLMDYLRTQHVAELNYQTNPLAFWAIENKNYPVLEIICQKCYSLDKVRRFNSQDHLLYCAAYINDAIAVNYLLLWGMDVNLRASYAFTALHQAAILGYHAVVERLMHWKADINTPCSFSETPLMLASDGGHLACVESLLRHGANIDYCNSTFGSALHVAVENNRTAVVACLLDHGINPDLENGRDKRAIDIAKKKQSTACYHLLVNAEKRFIPECIQLLDEQLLKPLAKPANNSPADFQRYQNALALKEHIAALQREDLTHREGILLREFIKALVKPATDNLEHDRKEKIAALEKFIKEAQYTPVWKTAGKILACIIITAAALITGAAIGMSVGFLAGAWAGPGAAMTSIFGLLQGIGSGWAIGTVATAALCGASTGGFTAWQFFKPTPAVKIIPVCEHLIPGYRTR